MFHMFKIFDFHLAPGQESMPMSGTISLLPIRGILVEVEQR